MTELQLAAALCVPFVVAALLAVLAHWFIRWRVKREMNRHRAEPEKPQRDASRAADSLRFVDELPKSDAADTLARRARWFRRAAALTSIVASMVCAAVLAYGDVGTGLQITARPTTLLLTHVWPLAITVFAVTVYSHRVKRVLLPATFLLVGVLAYRMGENSWLTLLYVVPATAILRLNVNSRFRTIAPLMTLVTLGLLGSGILGMIGAVIVGKKAGSPTAAKVTAAAVIFVLSCWGVYGLLRWLINAYRRKSFSDRSFQLAFIWITFCASYVVTRWTIRALGFGLLAFAAYWFFTWALRPILRLSSQWRNPASLLVLRVFGSTRAQILFDELGARWRSSGPLYVIAGPDSAETNLDLHEAAQCLFDIDELFVQDDRESLKKKIETLDDRPDPDGRFRIIDFYCLRHTWKATFETLANRHRSSAVLVDVTGWIGQYSGVAFEIERLFRHRPLDSFVLITGAISDEDQEALHAALRDLWKRIHPPQPKTSLPVPAICLLRDPSPRKIMTALCRAAVAADGWNPERLPATTTTGTAAAVSA